MKLHEILSKADNLEYIPYEEIKARKNQLLVYFRGYYNSEPIILIWAMYNTGGAGTITTESEFSEAMEDIFCVQYPDLNEEEKEEQRELILSYSIYLKNI
jgi:hypothetical protein